MQDNKKGSGSLVLVFVIIILGFVAYSIFKNKTLTPAIIESDQAEETSISTTPPQIEPEREIKPQTTSTAETQKETSAQPESLTQIESEVQNLEAEFNDLMLENLGFEQ